MFFSGPENFVLIIGAMKSGTTSLFNYLNCHPEICGSRIKEPFVFAVDNYPENIDSYRKQWDWNEKFHKIAMEASTDYTKLPSVKGVPKRVASLGKQRFKLIYLVRHPLARIESHIRYTILTKCEISGIKEETKNFSLASGISDNHVAFSSYAMQLDAWSEYFDRKDMFIVTTEELQSNTKEILARIIHFLGLYSAVELNNLHIKYAKTPKINQEYKANPFWIRLRDIKPLESMVTNLISSKHREYLRSCFGTDINRYRLNNKEEKEVLKRLMPDIKRLQREYQVDTNRWWGLG